MSEGKRRKRKESAKRNLDVVAILNKNKELLFRRVPRNLSTHRMSNITGLSCNNDRKTSYQTNGINCNKTWTNGWMLRENDQHLKVVESQTFCDSSQRSDPRFCGMSGRESKQLSLQEQISYVCAVPTQTKKVQLYGQDPPSIQATATQRIPPMFTTRKPYRHLHDTRKEKYTTSSRTHTVQCSTNT